MTLSPIPADPAAVLAHLGNDGLIAHIRAAVDLLAQRGVVLPPALVDELEEARLEHLARTPGGLDAVPVEAVA